MLRALVVVLAVAFVASSGRIGHAQTQDEASETFRLARDAYDRAEHELALRLFRQAFASSGSPVALLYVARSLRELGRPRDAASEYAQTIVVSETSARERDQRVRQTAITELEELSRQLATVRLVWADTEGVLRFGDRPVASTTRRLYETPGTYEVSYQSTRCARWTQTITLEAGRERLLEVPCPPRVASTSHDSSTAESTALAASTSISSAASRSRAPSAVGFSIGGAALLTGTTLQLVAGAIHRDLRDVCRDGCPDDAPRRADQGRRLERTSVGLFVASGVALGLGLVLWFLGEAPSPDAVALRF